MRRVCKHPDGCDRPVKGFGWCRAHLDRLRRSGDAGRADTETKQSAERPCIVDECAAPVGDKGARGMCNKHYLRWCKHGDPAMVAVGGVPQPLDRNPHWSGDNATYNGVHLRLAAQRGRATEYPCVDCGDLAFEWSYNNSHEQERRDSIGRYSTNLDAYDPRCVRCHRRFDAAMLTGARP